MLVPEIGGFVILFEHADVKPVFRQAEVLRDEFPREVNRILFEIIAEGKIPELFGRKYGDGRCTRRFPSHCAYRPRARIFATLRLANRISFPRLERCF